MIRSRRVFTLEQIVNVTNWIHQFDPQNINYPDLVLPQNLKQLDSFARVALKDYPKQNRVISLTRNSLDANKS